MLETGHLCFYSQDVSASIAQQWQADHYKFHSQAASTGVCTCQDGPRHVKETFSLHTYIAHQAIASCSWMCKDAKKTKQASPDFHSRPGCTGGQLHIRASRVQVAGSAPPKSPFCSGLLLHLLDHLLRAQKQGCYSPCCIFHWMGRMKAWVISCLEESSLCPFHHRHAGTQNPALHWCTRLHARTNTATNTLSQLCALFKQNRDVTQFQPCLAYAVSRSVQLMCSERNIACQTQLVCAHIQKKITK